MRLASAVSFVAAVALAVAATHSDESRSSIANVPHVQQKPDFCGEACAQMWLTKLGKKWTQDQVFNISGVDPSLGRGCYTAELNTALKRIGFNTGQVWYKIDADKFAEQTDAVWKALREDLTAGIPSIVCMHYDESPAASEHFRLILSYDPKTDEVIYHEPAVAEGKYVRMSRDVFMKLWPLNTDGHKGTLIRLRLETGKIVDPPVSKGFTSADFAQHVMGIKKKLPAGFTIVVQPPFVVAGDEPAEIVRRRATYTVKWAAERLKQDYFAHDPDDILDVWLFKNDASYQKYTKELLGDHPDTPFGYYSPAHKALIMNIGTGGGTLIHEIVHPFMRSNFRACPPWFNEGLGSLYEQCSDRNGHIYGLTNWRLAGLQEAIGKGAVPSFKDLMEMDEDKFYRQDPGTNYAESRYLCYYLQENGLLAKFYKNFVAHAKDDPSGYKTLVKILEEKDMEAFKTRWETFVMQLRFP